MFGWFLFFLIGLGLFIVHFLLRRKPFSLRWMGVVLAGILGGALASLDRLPFVSGTLPIPSFGPIPVGFTGAIGILIADRISLFQKEFLQFFATLLIGIFIGVVTALWLLPYWFLRYSGVHVSPLSLILTFFVIGFLTAFGYTLPRRWFYREWK